MTRMYSPSPTVRSSRTPIYLRGAESLAGLGDDPTYIDPGSELTPPDFAPIDTSGFLNPATLIATPAFQTTDSILPNTLVAPSAPGGPGSSFSAADLAALSNAASNVAKVALAPGPSPRVTTKPPGTTNPLAQSSVIAGLAIPNLVLLGVGGLLLLSATRK